MKRVYFKENKFCRDLKAVRDEKGKVLEKALPIDSTQSFISKRVRREFWSMPKGQKRTSFDAVPEVHNQVLALIESKFISGCRTYSELIYGIKRRFSQSIVLGFAFYAFTTTLTMDFFVGLLNEFQSELARLLMNISSICISFLYSLCIVKETRARLDLRSLAGSPSFSVYRGRTPEPQKPCYQE